MTVSYRQRDSFLHTACQFLTDSVTVAGLTLVLGGAAVEVVLAALTVNAKRVLATVETVTSVTRLTEQLLVKETTVRQTIAVTCCNRKPGQVTHSDQSTRWTTGVGIIVFMELRKIFLYNKQGLRTQ